MWFGGFRFVLGVLVVALVMAAASTSASARVRSASPAGCSSSCSGDQGKGGDSGSKGNDGGGNEGTGGDKGDGGGKGDGSSSGNDSGSTTDGGKDKGGKGKDGGNGGDSGGSSNATTTTATTTTSQAPAPDAKAEPGSKTKRPKGGAGSPKVTNGRKSKGAEAVPPAQKLDSELTDAVDAALQEDPSARMHVLVFGSDAVGALQSVNATLDRTLAPSDGAGATVAASKLQQLAASKGVSYVMLDTPVLPTGAGADPASSLATLYPVLDGVPAAWSRGLSGKGVGIAVIDSGVAPAADFGQRLVQVRLANQDGALADAYGHGSFVAGIAGGSSSDGRYLGIAPGSTLYAVNVARTNGGVFSSDVIAGLDWVLANHTRANIRVVTISLSETAPSSYLSNPLDTAVEQLWRAGIVVVVAAGNLGANSAVFAPANDPFAITVGATDSNDTVDTAD